MNPMRQIAVFLLGFLLISCAHEAPKRAGHEMPFFDDALPGRSRAYMEYKLLEPSERARISYLLWRMEYSNRKFWRNDALYGGREGAAWLRWKMRTFHPNIDTAGEFIDEVATRSEKSKKHYMVNCAEEDCYHDLHDVLISELHALEQYELEQASFIVPVSDVYPAAGGKTPETTVGPMPPPVNETPPTETQPAVSTVPAVAQPPAVTLLPHEEKTEKKIDTRS